MDDDSVGGDIFLDLGWSLHIHILQALVFEWDFGFSSLGG